MTTATLHAGLDERDSQIRAHRLAALDAVPGIRVGDVIVFADGKPRRAAHVWEAYPAGPGYDAQPAKVQPTTGGSFHLSSGNVSFSGGLDNAVPLDTLTLTGETRDESVWFFHHDRWQAHNGVHTTIPVRVFTCSLPAPHF